MPNKCANENYSNRSMENHSDIQLPSQKKRTITVTKKNKKKEEKCTKNERRSISGEIHLETEMLNQLQLG